MKSVLISISNVVVYHVPAFLSFPEEASWHEFVFRLLMHTMHYVYMSHMTNLVTYLNGNVLDG